MDDATEYSLDVLTERLGNVPPLRPCDAFNLTKETGVAGMGLLLTYTVVLVQLKMNN